MHQVRMDEITARYNTKRLSPPALDADGWKLFKLLRTKSFRQEVEHVASSRKLETSLLKDNLPKLGEAVWIRDGGAGNAELSYFEINEFKVVVHRFAAFDARKYATMSEWLPFQIWFTDL